MERQEDLAMAAAGNPPEAHLVLRPELIEEDFVAVCGIVQRFAAQRGYFELDDLQEHLAAIDVELPETRAEWRGLFAEMQDVIQVELAAEGRPHRWLRSTIGRRQNFALAEVFTEPLAALPQPTAPKVIEPPVPAVIEITQPVEPLSLVALTGVLFEAGEDKIRVSTARQAVNDRLAADLTAAAAILKQGEQAGVLVRKSMDGKAYYLTPAAAQAMAADEAAARPTRSERELSLAEVKAATQIMDYLADIASSQRARKEFVKVLEAKFAGDLTERGFRKLIRTMENIDLVAFRTRRRGRATTKPWVEMTNYSEWMLDRDTALQRLYDVTTY